MPLTKDAQKAKEQEKNRDEETVAISNGRTRDNKSACIRDGQVSGSPIGTPCWC